MKLFDKRIFMGTCFKDNQMVSDSTAKKFHAYGQRAFVQDLVLAQHVAINVMIEYGMIFILDSKCLP